MISFFSRLSMQKKLMVIFFVMTLVPIMILFIILNSTVKQKELSDYVQDRNRRLNTVTETINRELYVAVNKSSNIANSTFVIDGLKRDFGGDINQVMEYYRLLDNFYKGFVVYEDNINEQFCMYPNNESMPEGKYISKKEKLMQKDIWPKLEKLSYMDILWEYTLDAEVPYLSVYRNINYYERSLGFLEIKIPLRQIILPLKNMDAYKNEVIELTKQDGDSIYVNQTGYDTNLYKESALINGSIISISIDKRYIFNEYYTYALIYIILFLIVGFAVFFFYKAIVYFVMKDLYKFIQNIQENEGLLLQEDLINTGSDKDIALIKQKFKDLIKKTGEMYQDIISINKTKKVLELELLQSGINPHLLYNSLSVIKWRMLRKNENDLAEMIDNMTEYYRLALSGGNSVIDIASEIKLIEKYIMINKFSYGEDYKLTIDADDEVLGYPTIKLILQPIVENAVIHGLNGVENGEIDIKIYKEGNDIVFTVTDNGYGMSEEDIDRALNMECKSKYGGYGIKNTINRIKTYYGEGYGITITSAYNKGTTVVIRIECIDEEALMKRVQLV